MDNSQKCDGHPLTRVMGQYHDHLSFLTTDFGHNLIDEKLSACGRAAVVNAPFAFDANKLQFDYPTGFYRL